jgi:hypothetical protein
MQLNEQASKIDSKLENICRKIEATARSNPNNSTLVWKSSKEGKEGGAGGKKQITFYPKFCLLFPSFLP